MKIAVVGAGYVGLVTAACLAEAGNQVICVDDDNARIAGLTRNVFPVYEPGLAELVGANQAAARLRFTTDLRKAVKDAFVIFLAVGTPPNKDGSADISSILSAAGDVAESMDGYRIIVTKSTVPVGTYRQVCRLVSSRTAAPFDYVSNPEFLKEGNAVNDFTCPERIVIGTSNPAAVEVMKQLYKPFMRQRSRMIVMDPASAELTKYAANCMLAARISFMNELSLLCEKVGADIELVRSGIGSDRRIGSAFLYAGIGYGGSCFPKDVKALIHIGRQMSCPMTIIEAVDKANLRQQNRFVQRILDYFGSKAARTTLAVWGLAFKARTDDIRQSPAVFCIARLLDAGMKIRAYDPKAAAAAGRLFGEKIEIVSQDYAALNAADGLVILTDWQQFRNPDFAQIRTRLRNPVIFDGRNLYEPACVRAAGIEYHCLGRT